MTKTNLILTRAERLCPHCGVYPANGEWCPKCAGVFGPSAHRRADVYAALLRDMPMSLAHYNGEEFICRCCARRAYYAADIEHKAVCVVVKIRRTLTADDAEIARMVDTLDGDA